LGPPLEAEISISRIKIVLTAVESLDEKQRRILEANFKDSMGSIESREDGLHWYKAVVQTTTVRAYGSPYLSVFLSRGYESLPLRQ
jgi:hypothetical protein